MGTRQKPEGKLKQKTPRPRKSLWKRLVMIGAAGLFMLLMGCAAFGLVALSPTSNGTPLLISLLTTTPATQAIDTPTTEPLITQPPATLPPATLPPTASPPPEGTAASSPTPLASPTPLPTPDDVLRERHVPILMYHYISTPPPDADVYRIDLSTPPDQFYQQMRWLKENGYNVITLSNLVSYLNTGTPDLPDKPIVLTFDDGYVDNYQYALPVLKKFGYAGTFFILTDVTDRQQPGYMTWDMLREMQRAGMDIEVHGREHQEMTGRDRDWLVYHLMGPAQTIEANLGYQPRFLSYPSGHYEAVTVTVAQEMGYQAAVTTVQGSLQTTASPFELRRLRVRGEWRLGDFIAIVQEFSE